MSLFELLAELRHADIRLWVDGGDLRFNAPAGALTADLRTRIRAHKPEIVRFLEGHAAPAEAPLVAVPRTADLLLSFAQERLWFLDRLEPGSPAYGISATIRLTGTLDPSILARSLTEIVRRHEVLRTTFPSPEGRPRQRIAGAAHVHLAEVDLEHVPEGARHAEARAWIRAENLRPFDLEDGPLLRASLLGLGPKEHWLFVAVHHIVFDGWSFGVFFGELGALYQAFSTGKPSPLPEPPLQYADFAAWQRKRLTDPVLEHQLSYWKHHLGAAAGEDEASRLLPTDRPRGRVRTHRGATVAAICPPEIARRIELLAREENATPFAALLATFHLFLHLVTGRLDPRVGSPVANRAHPATENMVGFFVNTLVFQADLSGEPSFREVVRRTRRAVLDGHANQDLPFEKLVQALEPVRSSRHTPLFQVMFALYDDPPRSIALPGLDMSAIDTEHEAAKFDVILSLAPGPEGMAAAWQYNVDLFERATIEKWQRTYIALLERAANLPDLPLTALLAPFGARRDELHAQTNLTPWQLTTWLVQELHPPGASYDVAALVTFDGPVALDHFRAAFADLVRRADSFRTVIEAVDGVPRFRVLRELAFTLEGVDFSAAPDPDASFRAWLEERRALPLVLGRCTFDAALVALGDAKTVFYLRQHHMLTDGASLVQIARALAEGYGASRRGRLPLERLPSYAAHLEKERARLLEGGGAHFASTPSKKRAPLELYGRAAKGPLGPVRRASFVLDRTRAERLRARAAELPIAAKTPDGALLDVFATLVLAYLARITGEEELALGVVFHGRRTESVRRTLGMMIDVLPIRVPLGREPTFASVLERVAEAIASGLAEREPGAPERAPRRPYDVLLNFRIAELGVLEGLEGVPARLELLAMQHQCESLAVEIWCHDRGSTYTIDFDGRSDVFSQEQLAWATKHFAEVVDAFLEDRTKPLSRVDLLGPEERRFVLMNDTERPLPEATVPARFAEQAKRTPERCAVRFGERRLTYAELDARSNQLARRLRALGVRADGIVGVYMRRSPEVIVALLGILKAGGAYLPLDADYPPARLQFVLADAEVKVVLTQEAIAHRLVEFSGTVLPLDSPTCTVFHEEPESAICEAAPSDLAYAIYTSGSTGTPKGVLIPHRAFLNHNLATIAWCAIVPSDRVLQFQSLTFDAAAEEIFPTLLCGATLVLSEHARLAPSSEFNALLEREGVTFTILPTAYWHEWVHELSRTGTRPSASLRMVFVGGENASAEHLSTWQALGGPRWSNGYGPTEGTITTIVYDGADWPARADGASSVPIGRPFPNTTAYVLDPERRPVPVGTSGELYIGGAGLARGYLHRPELTAERFVLDPFRGPGARMYRTGDRARILADGQIECLGRVDHQVKVRGFRVELGEIEVALRDHPKVRDAAVVIWEGRPGDKRLVAYVVPHAEDDAPAPRDLRAFLEAKVPGYMVPASYAVLASLPLTAIGKVDRKALEAIRPSRTETRRELVAPRTAMEIRLRAIWEEVLQVSPLGVEDDFFEVGGHSLLVARLVALIREQLGVALPLTVIFEEPTIAQLAAHLSRGTFAGGRSSLIPIRARGVRAPLFCVAPGSGLVLGYIDLGRSLDPEQPLYAFEPPGLHDGSVPLGSIGEMADTYLAALRSVQPHGPYRLGGWSMGGVVALEMARRLEAQGEPTALVVLFDTAAPPAETSRGAASDRGALAHLAPHAGTSAREALDALKREGAVPLDVTEEQFERSLHVFGASLRALDAYTPFVYGGDVVLFRARDEAETADASSQWRTWLTGRFEVVEVPGTHVNLFNPSHGPALAEALRDRLARADLASPGAEVGPSSFVPQQQGVRARRAFAAGDVLFAVTGPVRPQRTKYSFQLGPDAHIDPLDEQGRAGLGRYLNHACEPNAYARAAQAAGGERFLEIVARRPVAAGAEITIDYATFELETVSAAEACACASASCRGRITGFRDLPDHVRAAYTREGILSPHLHDGGRDPA
ncbi:amino acid adenylation domain-containing protein [Pendulispora albinea]|uniref:Amino acid adenylation domain-containing protein n=1 Tax=Pendulispora albinea TaxID=2741071 RepID=A0ABZ2M4Z8_9BACT